MMQSITGYASRLWHISLLLLICLSPTLPNWIDQRLPDTHEVHRYMMLGDWFADALAAGIWYPRWLPEMNGGFGYPEFVFYQPAYFFINALAALFSGDLFLRQLLTLSFIALLGGLGVYRLARCYVTPPYALLMVATFQLAPYVHTNLYIRGDLSEWMVLALVPWPVYFLQRLVTLAGQNVWQRIVAWLGMSLTTAILCYSHPVAVMFLPPILLFLGGICLIFPSCSVSNRRLALGFEVVSAVVMGLILSAPYWLTVAMMKPFVNAQAALGGYFSTWDNTTPIQHLLFGSFIGGASFNEREFLGAPFVLLTFLGWWFGRKTPLVFGAGLVYFAILVVMIPFGKAIWHIYPFQLLQFPWRLAVFVPLLQVVCALGLKDVFSGKRLDRPPLGSSVAFA